MPSDFRGSLLQFVPNHLGGSSNTIDALQLKRERANLISELPHGTNSYWAHRQDLALRPVRPPVKVDGSLEFGERVCLISKAFGIEDP